MQGQASFKEIDVQTAKQRLDEGWSPYVLDVRGESEAAISRLDFTDRLQPHTQVHLIAHELPRDRDLLVYCRSGGRSAHVCMQLSQLGYDRLFNLQGGINDWAQAVDSSLPVY